MKILIIMGGFFPGKEFGGPPVSVDNFCSLLSGYVCCYVVTHNHDLGETTPYSGIKDGWNDRGNAKVKYVRDSKYNSRTFEGVIREIQPNYIYLQGLFQDCIFPCLWLAKKHHINVVLAPRGELCKGAFRKKYKKLPYIAILRMMSLLKEVHFQSTSEEETLAIKKYLGVSSERIHLLTNIPSIPHDLPDRMVKDAGVGRFVFVSRILWKKNLLSAIEFLSGVEGKAVFDIYGPKEEENYWVKCENAISKLPGNVTVNYRGVLNHEEIHKVFSQYDAFLFPTLSENYGHVIAEALVAGCIPIISDQTPWNDINVKGAGWALSLSDENRFRQVIQEVVNMDEETIDKRRDSIRLYIDNKFNLVQMKADYLGVFQ